MSAERVWTIEVTFTEDVDATRADATLTVGGMEVRGWGRSKRAPGDPDVPIVGEEVAAARALTDLSHHLMALASRRIELWEHHPVQIHG